MTMRGKVPPTSVVGSTTICQYMVYISEMKTSCVLTGGLLYVKIHFRTLVFLTSDMSEVWEVSRGTRGRGGGQKCRQGKTSILRAYNGAGRGHLFNNSQRVKTHSTFI